MRKKNGLKKSQKQIIKKKMIWKKKKTNDKIIRERQKQNERRWQKSRKERWKGVIFVHNIRKILFLVFSPNWRDWFLVGIRRKYLSSTKISPIFNYNQTTQKTFFAPMFYLPYFHSNQMDWKKCMWPTFTNLLKIHI